ncbi:MAG: PD40 domain-containing protein [Deltaproteobacteria bacterium]|nr:PD40 domain-containing protein [Deltaproteobacteria bacterium]
MFRRLPFVALALAVAVPAPAQTPAPPPDDPGLHVIIEATQRPLDSLLVLPPVCAAAKKDCEVLEQVLNNDARLSGFVRPIHGTAAHAAQMVKAPLPGFALRASAAAAAGANFVLATAIKPGKEAGYYELHAAVAEAREGKLLPLQDYAVQVSPAASLRSMAHRVFNGVQGALTGIEGSFDTVIFFSSKAPGCDRCIYQVDADGANRRILVADPGIHMFPVQLQDGGLMYTSFRSGMPSLYKLDAMQLMAMSDLTPTLPKGKSKKDAKTADPKAADGKPDPAGPPVPFAAGKDLQFRGCAQNARGELVATINDGDQAEIWSIDWSGQPNRNLTNHPANDLSPTFSPDGEYIAFVSDRTGEPQVYAMAADGSGVRRLTFAGNYNADPDWGPDGKIAYSGQRGNALDVLTVTLQGKMQRLTPGLGRRSLEPTWSPDGRRLIYVSNEDGKGHRLWITAADGAAREPIEGPFGQFYTPSWQRMPGKQARSWPRL